MKKFVLLLALLISVYTTIGQNAYSTGFKKGYEKGFCHNQGFGCVPPLSPVVPIPRVGESNDSYNDGYNRGFEMGLNDNKENREEDKNNDDIYKGSTDGYPKQTVINGYNRQPTKYNKTTSSINEEAISRGLSSLQNKIDRNRASIIKKIDEITNRRDLLTYEINKLNNPTNLIEMKNQINDNIKICIRNLDTGSNASTLTTISCLNGQMTNLDILEKEIMNYSISNGSKTFRVRTTTKKDVEYCSIVSIRNINGKTAIEFDYISPYVEEGWINIDPNTYLYDATHKKDFKLIGVLGTKFSPEKRSVSYNQKIKFILYFEQIPIDTKTVSIIECENDSCFNFYGIEIF